MKSFLSICCLSIGLLATTGSFAKETQQKQLSKDVKLEYQHFERTGNDDKYEVQLQDPHVFVMGTPQTGEPKIIAEIDHKGLWKLNVDTKANSARSQSEGTTHLFVKSKEGGENPIDFTLSGNITKLLVGNFANSQDIISKMRSGSLSSQDVLSALQNIKEAKVEGKNVKVIVASDPKNALMLEGDIHYQHTFGAAPEEFTFKVNIQGDATNKLLLTKDSRSSLFSGKVSLADWSKLWSFAQSPTWNGVPEGKLDWNVLSKSDLETTEAKFLFTATQGKSLQFELHEKVELVSDWIKRFLAKVKENPPGEQEDSFSQSIYKWLNSPKTLPLYSLIPLQSLFDLSGSFDYIADPSFVVQKGNAALSLLGKKGSGVKLVFNSENIEKGNLQIIFVGGRPSFNRFISFYNALEDSLIPFLPQDTYIGLISPAMKEDLFKILLSYSKDPKSENKDLVLDVKFDGWNITIGNKSVQQFIIDLYQLKSKQPEEKTREDA